MVLQWCVPPGGAEAVEDEEAAAAVAEAGARTEAEAPTGAVTGGEAVAVAEAGGGRGSSLTLLARESCLASGLARLELCVLRGVSLFTEAGGLQVCGLPLWPLGYRIGRPRRDGWASRAILLVSGHR